MTGYSAALLIFAFLFPGAFFAWGFERSLPRYGKQLKDWLLKLAGASAVWIALGAWPLHWLYTSYWDDFAAGEALPWQVYIAPAAYLAVPASAGLGLGWLLKRARNRGWKIKVLLDPNREPTAWDRVFGAETGGFVRCRLRSGRWVGGLYDESQVISSYVSHGEFDRDIYISRAAEFDQGNGAPILRESEIAWLDGGIYLKESDIESLEFTPLDEPRKGRDPKDGEGSQTDGQADR